METIFETITKNRLDPGNIDTAVNNVVSKITTENPKVNAVIWQDETFTNNEIARVKNSVQPDSALFGLPILVKEIESPILGTPNSWGNKTLKEQGYRDTYSATSTKLLQDAGAIIVGKTNNCELAINVTTNSFAHGPTLNPNDLSRNAGGSSGGSAAGVATGMVRIATGNDGGGSIRIPAAHCGIFGYKSSMGRISNGPIIGAPWAGLSTKGLLGLTIKEIAKVADIMSVSQPGDLYSSGKAESIFLESLNNELPKLKIGIRTTTIGNSSDVNRNFITATNMLGDFLSDQGHEVIIASPAIFDQDWILKSFDNIIASNAKVDFEEMIRRSNNAIKLDDSSSSVQYFVNQAENISSSQYVNSCYDMEYFAYQTAPFFEDFDILLTPTVADYAPINSDIELYGEPPYNPYSYAGFTCPINFIGACAIALPISPLNLTPKDELSTERALQGRTLQTELSTENLPLSVQIASKRNNDTLLFQMSHYLECNYPNIHSNSLI